MSTNSRSERRSTTPKWRSLSSAKKPRPATSVSLVFAQPQQGAPLRSAIDNLPAVGIDDSASFVSEMSRKRERLLSASSSATLGEDQPDTKNVEVASVRRSSRPSSLMSHRPAEASPEDPPPVIDLTADAVDSTPRPATESPEATAPLLSPSEPAPKPDSIPFPATEPSKLLPAPAPKPSPSQSSWFGSWSRSKGKDRAEDVTSTSQVHIQQPTSKTLAPPELTQRAQSDPGPIDRPPSPPPLPTQPIAVPSPSPVQASPSGSSSPQGTVSPVGATGATTMSNTASISSIDDVVPKPKSLSDNEARAIPRVALERKPSITTLNPSSSSMFTLRLPLLGRPKMPLDQAVAAAQSGSLSLSGSGESGQAAESGRAVEREAETLNANAAESESTLRASASASASASQATDAQDPATSLSNSTGNPNATTNESEDPNTKKNEQQGDQYSRSYSWWDYLGLGGGASSSSLSRDEHPGPTTTHPRSDSEVKNPGAQAGVKDPGSDSEVKDSELGEDQDQDKSIQRCQSSPELRVIPASPEIFQPSSSNGCSVGDDLAQKGEAKDKKDTAQGVDSPDRDRAKVLPSTSEDRPPSLFSAETSKSQGSASVWYYPWSWYYSQPANAEKTPNSESNAATPTQGPSSSDTNGKTESMLNGKTESEMVKEKALARENSKSNSDSALPSDPVSTSAATSPSAATSTTVPRVQDASSGDVRVRGDKSQQKNDGDAGSTRTKEISSSNPTESPSTLNPTESASNPIETSISSNRSGWASFFMSRALMMRSIADEPKERDENGMEVMNIDDDEGEVLSQQQQPQQQVISHSPRPSVSSSSAVVVASADGSNVTGKELSVQTRRLSTSTSTNHSGSPPNLPKAQPKEREPKKPGPPAPPLTESDSIKRDTTKPTTKPTTTSKSKPTTRTSSPTPSRTSGQSSPTFPSTKVQQPNLVLPTWADTFHTLPRSYIPPPPPPPPKQVKSKLSKTISYLSSALSSSSSSSGNDAHAHDQAKGGKGSVKGKEREQVQQQQPQLVTWGQELPKAFDILGQPIDANVLNGSCRVVVIGVAGWSPGAVTRTIAGGLPSPSAKFVDMTCLALEKFEEEHNVTFKKITRIALEGDGTIARKVEKVHAHLLSKPEWIEDLHLADVIFVAAHSQGSIVSIHLLDRLIHEGHILTPRNVDILNTTAAIIAPGGAAPPVSTTRTQKICCLALCGIHLGPLRYLKTSSLLQPYIQYFENAAARELFDFQNTETQRSKDYVQALRNVMDHGAKVVYVASLNDQVVPIYSGLFTAASHPRILRALYIDGDAYHSSDFLSNLLVLLIRILNAGLSDSGLLAHLSEATAGTLSGVGHSSAYEELATFSLAVDYMFLANDGEDIRTDLKVDSFNAVDEQNDYEIPWALRDLIADDRVTDFFSREIAQLRDAFDDWSPKTSILRDIKRKLQPIQRLSSIKGSSFSRL
ncbi:hypothetical protein K474DRAFT_1712157 [Panus rudis PR-1116 ss-1]|nr:hypothetical protein K474DRAFT_1712157 [Panus rudis PR-1116 ss-1]